MTFGLLLVGSLAVVAGLLARRVSASRSLIEAAKVADALRSGVQS